MGVTNIWNVLNLRESPFFQDPLDPDGGRYPIELFVGRRHEAELVLRGIGGAPHSRLNGPSPKPLRRSPMPPGARRHSSRPPIRW